MKRHLYEKDWERGEKVTKPGKQAHTYYARRRTDPEGAFNYILKAPKNQENSDLRARMYVEAASLQALDTSGVSRLAATNASDFKEEVELFLITEKVPGRDLDAYVASERPDMASAATTILFVLNTLSYCHQRSVRHRDIKPCHVILRDDHFSNPVLIDFGLAFKEDVDREGFETSTEHGIGNRFILMPEQLHPERGADKQDYRSDITQVVGLYFFLITGRYPGILLDENRTKPHQRLPFDEIVKGTPNQLAHARQIFDAGFEWDAGLRWQSINSLEAKLRKVTENEPDTPSVVERAKALRAKHDDRPDTLARRRFQFLQSGLDATFQGVVHEILPELGEHVQISLQGASQDPKLLQWMMKVVMTNQRTRQHRQSTWGMQIFELKDVMAFAITEESSGKIDRELCRLGAFDPAAPDEIKKTIGDYILKEAEETLNAEEKKISRRR